MAYFKKRLISQFSVSIVLLFLFSLRIVPFGLFHFHYSQQKDFSNAIELNFNSDSSSLNEQLPVCSFDDFLSLIVNGFVPYDLPVTIIWYHKSLNSSKEANSYGQGYSPQLLNKGSPA